MLWENIFLKLHCLRQEIMHLKKDYNKICCCFLNVKRHGLPYVPWPENDSPSMYMVYLTILDCAHLSSKLVNVILKYNIIMLI